MRESRHCGEQVRRGVSHRQHGDGERRDSFARRHRQRIAAALRHPSRGATGGSQASVRPRSRSVFLEFHRRAADLRDRRRRFVLPGRQPPVRAASARKPPRGLCRHCGFVRVRRHLMVGSAEPHPTDQGRSRLLRGGTIEQGSDPVHRAVRRQRRVARSRRGARRHRARRRDRPSRVRRCRVARDRAGAVRDVFPARERNQGAADRRARAGRRCNARSSPSRQRILRLRTRTGSSRCSSARTTCSSR